MKILLFGITRDIIGSSVLELPQISASKLNTVDTLRNFLLEEYPALKKLSSLAIAVNNNYATENTEILQEDEVALIPPVSGG
jgi:molybdopterin converting factor subunit 1